MINSSKKSHYVKAKVDHITPMGKKKSSQRAKPMEVVPKISRFMGMFKKVSMSNPLPTRTIQSKKVLREKPKESFMDFFNRIEKSKPQYIKK